MVEPFYIFANKKLSAGRDFSRRRRITFNVCLFYVVEYAQEKNDSGHIVFVVVVVSHISALVANPKKTTLHGGRSRSWSAEQGKKEKGKVWQHPPPPPRVLLVRRKNKIK